MAEIDDIDRNKNHTKLISIYLAARQIVEKLIRGIDDIHHSSTLKTLRRYGYDPRVGRI